MFQSFSMPFFCMRNLDIEQPVFGANYIKGEVKSEQMGRWEGQAKFKLWFNNGGAIEFGQCLLNAGRLASQARAAEQVITQTYNANIYPAPPPAYSTLNPNTYGWVPMGTFPDRPEGSTVFMYDTPPPYTGIFQDPQMHQFDQRTRVVDGYVDPNNPNKMYVGASAPPPAQNEAPPSYNESLLNKKKE
jgi:WW domain-binding protein 2